MRRRAGLGGSVHPLRGDRRQLGAAARIVVTSFGTAAAAAAAAEHSSPPFDMMIADSKKRC